MKGIGYIITDGANRAFTGDIIYTNKKEAEERLAIEYTENYSVAEIAISTASVIDIKDAITEYRFTSPLTGHDVEVLKNDGYSLLCDDDLLEHRVYVVLNPKCIKFNNERR